MYPAECIFFKRFWDKYPDKQTALREFPASDPKRLVFSSRFILLIFYRTKQKLLSMGCIRENLDVKGDLSNSCLESDKSQDYY